MEISFTKEQSIKIVEAFTTAGFIMHGYGHFNITEDEMAEVVSAATTKNRIKNCCDVYERLYVKYMG